jgi:hypothetical protein
MIQPRITDAAITDKHSGKVTVDKRVLVPQDVMIFLLFNPRDFEVHWVAVQMNSKLLEAELPVNVENAVMSKIMDLGSNYFETAIWQSVYNPTAIADAITNGFSPTADRKIFFNGYLARMLNDADVVKIPTPATLTKTNIIGEMEKVKYACPVPIKNHPDLKYLMNPNTFEIYESAQQGQNFKGANVTDAGKRSFTGVPIEVLSGLPDNTILLSICRSDIEGMFWFGVNEVEEDQILELKKYRPESELYYVKGLAKIDANYAVSSQIVLYTTWTAPSTYEEYD